MMIKRILIAAAILAATVAMLALYHPALRPAAQSGNPGTVAIGGPFTLVDGTGKPFTDVNLKGGFSLVFFGFTHCPDICPLVLQTMTDGIDQAGSAGERVTPVFISVDPERDTVEAVGNYVSAFHPRFVGLTGSPEQVAEVMRVYRVYARKVPIPGSDGKATGDYTVEHTGIIFLMGPDGRYRSHFSAGATAEEIAAALRREIKA